MVEGEQLYKLEKVEASPESLNTTLQVEAEEQEKENLAKVEKAIERMHEALDLQRSTTLELKLQGEKIRHIKEAAISVHTSAELVNMSSHRLKQESNLFPGIGNMVRAIKRWWNKDKKVVQYIEKAKTRRQAVVVEEEVAAEKVEPLAMELVPGENKTDGKLGELLTCVKKMRAGAVAQIKIAEGQEGDIGDVKKIGEFVETLVDNTERDIKKR